MANGRETSSIKPSQLKRSVCYLLREYLLCLVLGLPLESLWNLRYHWQIVIDETEQEMGSKAGVASMMVVLRL